MRKLVDVSSYNGVVSWEKAKTYGCQGAILKIIRKDLNRDKKFNENYAACNENEIAWGVYNYSYATTATKAKSDMELVCDILDKIDKIGVAGVEKELLDAGYDSVAVANYMKLFKDEVYSGNSSEYFKSLGINCVWRVV